MNKVIIVGNVGKAPELKQIGDGQSVINFSVAVNEKWKDKSGQEQKHTEWFNVAYFGKGAAAVAKYLEQGKQVLVEGKLKTRSWEGKDGQKQYRTELQAQHVQLLGSKPGGGSGQRESGGGSGFDGGASGGGGYSDDSDIPF